MPYVCNLSPEIQKYAKEFLNEDPETRDAKIEEVRQWLNKQPHLNARTDDWFIVRFLRRCKFCLEDTKQRIDTYYTVRNLIPEFFKDRDPSCKDMRAIFEAGGIIPLPKCDVGGRTVSISRNGMMNPSKFPMDDVMKALYMLIDVIMEDNETASVMGINFIMDTTGFSAAHALAFTPTMSKKCIVLFQDSSYWICHKMHYINTTPAFEGFFNMCKRFLNEELTSKLTVHSDDLSPFYKEIPQEILTEQFGGKESTQAIIDNCIKMVDEKRDWILEQNKYGVDESKRPGKPKTSGDLFGIDDSILKLNID